LQINRFLPLVDSYDRGDHLNAASHGSSRSLAGSSTHNSFTQCNNGIATPTSAIPPVAPKLAPAGAAWAECEPPSGVLINMRFAPTVREELVSETSGCVDCAATVEAIAHIFSLTGTRLHDVGDYHA
jgi:hypothetical protein